MYLISHSSPPPSVAKSSPPTDAHVPLGLLVAYEGMSWSPAPEPAPRQCPLFQGPFLQCPLLHRAPPDVIVFPKKIFGGGHMSLAKTAKATEDPPWPPELPASPWRTPVSPSWTSLQGAHPPPRWICCGVGHAYLEGGIMSGFWTLFFVFPLPFLSFLIWLFSCSC